MIYILTDSDGTEKFCGTLVELRKWWIGCAYRKLTSRPWGWRDDVIVLTIVHNNYEVWSPDQEHTRLFLMDLEVL